MKDIASWLSASRVAQFAVIVLFVPPIAVAMASLIVFTSGFAASLTVTLAAILTRTALDYVVYGVDVFSVLLPERVIIICVAVGSAALVRKQRSLNFGLQAAVLGMVIGILVFRAVVGDLQTFWMPIVAGWIEAWQALVAGDVSAAPAIAAVSDNAAVLAAGLTGWSAWSYWVCVATGLVLGHAIWRVSRDIAPADRYGSFLSLRGARVIALLTLVLAIAGAVLKWPTVENLAAALLLTFLLPGLSLAHWVVRSRGWPGAVLVAMYLTILVLPLTPFVILAICIAGYVDAWFNLAPGRTPAV